MKKPLLIVSAFGRGQSIAVRLLELDHPVVLFDVTSQLGSTGPEDEEGPFGFFPYGVHPVSVERFHQDDPPERQDSGFCVVLKDGPLDLRGPFSKTRKTVSKFEQWGPHFTKSFWSNQVSTNPRERSWGKELSIDQDFWVRFSTRPGLEKSLDWCRRRGVRIETDCVIEDLAKLNRSQIKSIQIRPSNSQTSEPFEFDGLVWALSSEETQYLSPKLCKKLFPQGPLRPIWAWVRLRSRISSSVERHALPIHSAWIKELDFPWLHENLLVLQKTPSEDFVDIWMRVPAERRRQMSYVNERFVEALVSLRSRFTESDFELSPWVSDLNQMNVTTEAPARHPLFDPEELASWKTVAMDNLFLMAPEFYGGLGWNHLFSHEDQVISKIIPWLKKLNETQKRREEKSL